jgi:hypothetical protein
MVFSGYFGVLHNKPDHLDIAKLLLKVALNTISLTLYVVLYSPCERCHMGYCCLTPLSTII